MSSRSTSKSRTFYSERELTPVSIDIHWHHPTATEMNLYHYHIHIEPGFSTNVNGARDIDFTVFFSHLSKEECKQRTDAIVEEQLFPYALRDKPQSVTRIFLGETLT